CRTRRHPRADQARRRRTPRAMSTAASQPDTSSMDVVKTMPKKRPKRRRPSYPPAAAASPRAASRRVPVWAARGVFLLGLLNIASAVARRSPRLLDWSEDYLPPFGAVASVP